MSLVREVRLVRSADGVHRIAQRPVLPADTDGLSVFELSAPAAPGDRHAIVLSGDDDERLVITVDGDDRSITCDRTLSGRTDFHAGFPSVDWAPLPVGTVGAVDLTIVVDGMIVEIYAGGGLVTMTEQVFPREP
ncbi:glycoside hydrolase family 32 protein, partial [Pseudomonas sp. BGM005]|nr:glycoside hydrolase family 32 protein [Pseudomonas sp. BG5]